MNIASDKKVGDITVRELRELVREIVAEIVDPDYGLELRDEVIEALRESWEQKKRGEGIPLEKASKKFTAWIL
ncbi:MAG: hypothetical protein AUK39_01705 [Dehalococcoidia bacterium CG2_30_46_19]|nr:MAG: hypothetical protein AUK39_01705 [Dehalococcoidia bacterium CG2_30_46_19]